MTPLGTKSKIGRTAGALALLVMMTMSPLVVYAATPRAFTGGITSAPTTTYSGRAFDAQLTIGTNTPTPVSTTVVDTGPLPSGGGVIDASVVDIDLSGVSADALVAVTMGFDSKAQSKAAVAAVSIPPGSIPGLEGFSLSADFAMAQSIATCTGVSGSSDITNLVIEGNSFTIGSTPQAITLPGGVTVILNEQDNTSSGGTNSITVNAIHIMDTLLGIDIIIASAQ